MTAVKQSSTPKNKKAGKFHIEYFIKATTPNEEDYSGATITEWFDSGREIDAIASPYDYSVCKNGFEVIWQGSYENIKNVKVVEEAVDQIKYWASVFDATFNSNSYILLKDSEGKIVNKFNLE